jgi:phage-related protein
MSTSDVWAIEFYVAENGDSPVGVFLAGLDAKTQARFLWSLEQLSIRNVRARPPLVRHLEGKLWELREESGTNIYRLLYVFFTGRRIVILHGFQKKTQRTPRREIETALARLDRFVAWEEAEKGGHHE